MFITTHRRYIGLLVVLVVITLLPAALPAAEDSPSGRGIEAFDISGEALSELPPEKPFIKEQAPGEPKRNLRRIGKIMLKRMDQNNDGGVDVNEIHMALQNHGLPEEEIMSVAERLMEYDVDGDETLSEHECKAMVEDRPKLLREFLIRKKQFREKFDFNRDGTIDEQEWSRVREARKRFEARQHLRGLRGGQHAGTGSPHGAQTHYRASGYQGHSPSRKTESHPTHQTTSPAQMAAQIHENIVRVFQYTAKRLEKAGDLDRSLIVHAKLAEVEVHLAKALIRIQAEEFDEAVNELNNIVEVAKSLPEIGPFPEIEEEDTGQQE